jgi:hypothetical protein
LASSIHPSITMAAEAQPQSNRPGIVVIVIPVHAHG